MDRTVALRFSFYAGMDNGRDNGSTVEKAYRDKAPYAFRGTAKKLVLDLKPDRTSTRRRCTRPSTTVPRRQR